jgi:chromate transporter
VAERADPASHTHGVPFREAARFWVKLGFINFGGPTGQIAIMHDEIVERRRWITNGRFLHALNFCMLLPGPEAQQLAIYIGWLLHKVKGGVVAGVAFVLPSFFVMLALSWLYAAHGDVTWVSATLSGLAAAVIGIVASATIRIGRKALANGLMAGVAAVAFVSIFLLHVPFPLIVLGAVVIGVVGGRVAPRLFDVGVGRELEENERVAVRDDVPGAAHTRPSLWRSAGVLIVGSAVWLIPIGAVAIWRGPGETLTDIGWFFSKAALVTFGGAYAVLSYVNVAAVAQYAWLLPGQMVVGLGLAETTPGPLIMVLEFVGFVGAYRNPDGLSPLVAGVLGAVVATWATFAPCFLWIFLGAPYIERLRGNRRMAAALESVTAAVVGVIANLAVTFAAHTLFDRVREVHTIGGAISAPVWSSVDLFAVVVAAVSFVGLWRFRWKMMPVIAASAFAGLIVNGVLR